MLNDAKNRCIRMHKSKMGRPKKPEGEVKQTRSIRLTDNDYDALVKRYETLQGAIDAMIEEDHIYWQGATK